MKLLSELLNPTEFKLKNCDEHCRVLHLTHDSRSVKVGSLFFAIKGVTTDGSRFIKEAIARGAVAVVVQKEQPEEFPQIIVPNIRQAMSLIAKAFFDNACDRFSIIGITGTNGKTTTSHIIQHLVTQSHGSCGIIGTLGAVATFKDGSSTRYHFSSLTTPDPVQLHEIFYELEKSGVSTVVMECSAHAICLDKLAGIKFKVGIFTNLSQDHLDFFPNYRAYADTKVNWFDKEIETAIINIDDVEGVKIFHNRQVNNLQSIVYAMDEVVCSKRPDEVKLGALGSKFLYLGQEFELPLAGRFNIYNALAAIEAVKLLDASIKDIALDLKNLPPIPGRFNTIDVSGRTVIIDYAHTPDSLKQILVSSRELLQGDATLTTVFGCGGDRDKTKRDKMGVISGKLSDFTVITSDNPRTESPRSVMLQIEAGCKLYTKNYVLIQDREEAIHYALEKSRVGDIIVIAGKGAEDYLEIGHEKIPYSDAKIVNEFRASLQK